MDTPVAVVLTGEQMAQMMDNQERRIELLDKEVYCLGARVKSLEYIIRTIRSNAVESFHIPHA